MTSTLTLVFQSTLPVWGGTDIKKIIEQLTPISIHPPRVGRDGLQRCHRDRAERISIHPPRVGRDIKKMGENRHENYFNPPSPCGEGPGPTPRTEPAADFNPPSPCGEGPEQGVEEEINALNFNPPSPCGEGHSSFPADKPCP